MACRPVIAANIINIRGFIILGNQIFSRVLSAFSFSLGRKAQKERILTEEIDPREDFVEGKGKDCLLGEKVGP
ncbi:hypothetical protein CEXT_651111 [Caerostris extrusa]|uniref:Uncharacterized protein n=1 Tax=Caerostris extrusa TaxID=172846 RepID=A0AAV4T6J7_CAEEX|nr:hypothetical protein CEXT_651111 [Caerostris extrusa]